MGKLSKRRAFILGVLGFAGLAAWRYRVLQVGSFMAAAGLHRLLVPDEVPDFSSLASRWRPLRPTRSYSPSQSRGMVTYHPWNHNFRPEFANNCLAEAAELGAGYIRIDIRWKDLIPNGRHSHEVAWPWYHSYLIPPR